MRHLLYAPSLMLFLGVLPSTGWSHTLTAPDTVKADGAGNFSFDAIFTAGPGDALIGSYVTGGINVSPSGVVSDCFCDPGLCTIIQNETLVIPVLGLVVDPAEPGRARVRVDLCDAASFETETVIVIRAEVPSTSSWSLVIILAMLLLSAGLYLCRTARAWRMR